MLNLKLLMHYLKRTYNYFSDSVMQVLRDCGVFIVVPENMFFHTVHDAVTFLMPQLLKEPTSSERSSMKFQDGTGRTASSYSTRPVKVLAQSTHNAQGHTLSNKTSCTTKEVAEEDPPQKDTQQQTDHLSREVEAAHITPPHSPRNMHLKHWSKNMQKTTEDKVTLTKENFEKENKSDEETPENQ